MKIPKQSKPVRRAGFANRLKIKAANQVTPSTIEDEPDGDNDDDETADEGDYNGDADYTGEEAEETFEGTDEAVE